MEARGLINCYQNRGSGRYYVYTINLAAGTTPFMKMFNGTEHQSKFYNLPHVYFANLTIEYGWYRPQKFEFDLLDGDSREYVLGGGLLCTDLPNAIERQLPGDWIGDVTVETFQAFCLKVYGVQSRR